MRHSFLLLERTWGLLKTLSQVRPAGGPAEGQGGGVILLMPLVTRTFLWCNS